MESRNYGNIGENVKGEVIRVEEKVKEKVEEDVDGESVIHGKELAKTYSITSADVIESYNRLLKQINDESIAQNLKDVKNVQNEIEENLIKNTLPCNVTTLSDIRDRIGSLKADELKRQINTAVYNPSVMHGAACTFDSILYTSPFDTGSLYLNNRIRLYVHNLRQLPSESHEGYTFLSDFDGAKDMFVIKTTRPDHENNLLHELIVGIYGTNTLRKYVPNFAYIYGGFKCSPPLVDPETKQVISWCINSNYAVNYILYENVSPSINMSLYIQKCTGGEFLNAFMQIIYALRIGLKMIDFTHYDLHGKKVLLRTLPEKKKFQIAYETERGIEYITTNVIATMIDYGYSHIKVGTPTPIEVGRHGLIQFSIFPYRSWIFHDIYKFLMFCLMSAYQYNNQSVIMEAVKIFRFFNQSEDPIVAVNSQWDLRFAFPLTDLTNTLSLDNLARHIRLVCDCSFIQSTMNSCGVLNCETFCLTERELFNKIGVDPKADIGIPHTIIEFHDIVTRLQNHARDAEKMRIVRAFNYPQAMQQHIQQMSQQIRDITLARRSLKLIDLSQMPINDILNYNTLRIIQSSYMTTGTLIDKILELRFYYAVGIAVANSYEDNISVNNMNTIMDRFKQEIEPSLVESRQVFVSNHRHLNNIQNDTVIHESLTRDPRLRWYWDDRNLFDMVFGKIN